MMIETTERDPLKRLECEIFSCRRQLLHSGFLSAYRPGLFYIIRLISELLRVRKLKIGEKDGWVTFSRCVSGFCDNRYFGGKKTAILLTESIHFEYW